MRKFLFALIAVTAACSDSSTDPMDDQPGDGSGDGSGDGGGPVDDPNVSEADRQQDYDDVAASLGAHLSASELPVMIDSIDMAFGRMPAGFSVVDMPDMHVLDGSRGGLAIQYTLYCRDAADAFAPCDGLQDHAHVDFTYSGNVTSATSSLASVERSAKWTVRGSTRPLLWIGGKGDDHFASSVSTGEYSITIEDTLDHVKLAPTPQTPVAGSITLSLTVDRTRSTASPAERSFAVEARVDFTSAQAATLTLDGSKLYQLDIATGAVARM